MKSRGGRGSGIVEAVTIGVVLIALTLALIDLVVIVMANGVNDTAAKNAARAAANENTGDGAYAAAQTSVNSLKPAGFVSSLTLSTVDYTPGGVVTCRTKIEVKLPVPVPGIGATFLFVAQATEPILTHTE